jgi:hypothetical protein
MTVSTRLDAQQRPSSSAVSTVSSPSGLCRTSRTRSLCLDTLWPEDFEDGRLYGRVRARDPFV